MNILVRDVLQFFFMISVWVMCFISVTFVPGIEIEIEIEEGGGRERTKT